jgi:hypothetical protein
MNSRRFYWFYVVVVVSCLLAVTSAPALGEWVLSFPDQATCEAFKAKGQAPGLAEWKAQKDTGKAPPRPAYPCAQRDGRPTWVLWQQTDVDRLLPGRPEGKRPGGQPSTPSG